MATQTAHQVVLEPAAQAFADAAAQPPQLHELSPDEARAVLDDVQAAPVEKLPVDERWLEVPAPSGQVRVRVVRPQGSAATRGSSCRRCPAPSATPRWTSAPTSKFATGHHLTAKAMA